MNDPLKQTPAYELDRDSFLNKKTVHLNIPKTAEEREAARLASWDKWYATLPDDLRRKLSLHDFKRLGEAFKGAFGIK